MHTRDKENVCECVYKRERERESSCGNLAGYSSHERGVAFNISLREEGGQRRRLLGEQLTNLVQTE